jgi:hypothetical protein
MAEPGLAKPAAAVQAANYKPENGALMERCRALGTYATHSCRIDTNAISVDVLALMALITFVLTRALEFLGPAGRPPVTYRRTCGRRHPHTTRIRCSELSS